MLDVILVLRVNEYSEFCGIMSDIIAKNQQKNSALVSTVFDFL